MSSGDPFLDALNARAGSVDLPTQISAALPGAVITSGRRSPAEQAALIARGATTATHSPHVSGNGFDVRPIDGMSPQDALAQLRLSGLPVNQVIDETHQGTGPHWHFAGDLGGQMPPVDQRAAPAPAVPPQPSADPAPPPQAPDQPDPYLQAIDAAMSAPHVGDSDRGPQSGAAGSPSAYADRGGGRVGAGMEGDSQGWGGWLASLDPLADSIVNGTNYGSNLRDSGVGILSGIASVPETMMKGAGWVVGKAGNPEAQATLDRWADQMRMGIDSLASNPDSNLYKSREIGGEIAATWPLAEAKGLQLLPGLRNAVRARELAQLTGESLPASQRLAAALARYGDMSAQGAAAAGMTSRGEDVGTKMGIGAVAAPAVGAVIEKALPAIMAVNEKVAGSKLAQGLRNAMNKGAPEAADAAGASGDAAGSAAGWSAQDLAQGWRRGVDGQIEFAPTPSIRKGSEVGPGEPVGGIGPDGKLYVEITPNDAAGAKPPLTPKSYVDQYLAGQGRGSSPTDLELQQYAANNGPAIEAEFSKRATDATRAGPGDMSPITPQRQAANLADAKAAAGTFVGQPIQNDATGVVATPSGNNLAKWTHSKAVSKSSSPEDHALAVANADNLFKSAQLIDRYGDPRGEPTLNISRWRAYMDTPNGVRGVKMTVKETAHPATPNPLYSIESVEVEPPLLPQGGVEGEPGRIRPVFPGGGSDPNIGASGPNSKLADALRQEAGQPSAQPTEEATALAEGLRREAIGSRGARAGVEANTNWPPEVAEHARRLVADGMGLDQALREAEITYVGAKPALAHVTRNPADQRAMWEGAKQDTIEGQQLATQIAQNNAALHATLQRDIQGYGGVPAQGEATELAARNLARRADLGREEVSKLYHEAQQAAGDVRVKPDELFAVVGNRRYRAAVTDQGRAFIQGMNHRLSEMTQRGRLGLTAPELDQLHQYASYAFDHSGPAEVNKLIWHVKDAIDHHLDQIGEAAPAYRRARNAHRIWAEQYENPEGVRRLIARRPDGTFLLEENWRRAENMITSLGDRQFAQVVRQLKATGDAAAIDRMKAAVVQAAYEHATGARGGNAVDMLGQSPVSGKMFLAKLDQIGLPKLRALFSAAELGRLASIGRAASHLNEAVPGTVNTSGTSSALLNALQKMKGVRERKGGFKSRATDAALFAGGQIAGHMVMPGVGGMVAGTAGNVVKGVAESAVESAAKRELANRLREAMDPTAARASAKAARERLTDALRRRRTARAIAAQTPPITGSAQKKRSPH